MIYFDARLSRKFPTVEIRVADVCLDASDTVLIASLCRGLVENAAQHWDLGEPPPKVDTALLRLATWQAGREGTEGPLVDPLSCESRPAREVITALVEHIRPALILSGDEARVDEQVERVFARGSGARRQREVLEKTGRLTDVVADLARVTAGQESQ